MAYAHKVVRATFFGTCFQDQEIWSTGFFLGSEVADAQTPTDVHAEHLAGLWSTFFASSDAKIGSEWKAKGVKLAMLNTDGKTDLENVVTYDYPTNVQGAWGSTKFPPQIALVASLRSSKKRGLGSHGRMYLPGVTADIQGNGHMADFHHPLIADAFGTFMSACAGNLNLPGYPILASKGGTGQNLAPGLNVMISEIKIGNVYDTQRRRRNGLTESYQTRELNPS